MVWCRCTFLFFCIISVLPFSFFPFLLINAANMRGHHIKAYRHSNHTPDWRTHYVYVQCVIGYDCKDMLWTTFSTQPMKIVILFLNKYWNNLRYKIQDWNGIQKHVRPISPRYIHWNVLSHAKIKRWKRCFISAARWRQRLWWIVMTKHAVYNMSNIVSLFLNITF